MITAGQNNQILEFLREKHLPLDIFVEIEDHMIEQIKNKMDFENKTFQVAFSETQKLWENDLTHKFSILTMSQITVLQSKISTATLKTILKKTNLYFVFPFILSIVLLCLNKSWAYYYFLVALVLITLFIVYISLKDYKTIKSTSGLNGRKISYLQKGASAFVMSGYMIPVFFLMQYTMQFEQFYKSFLNIIHLDFSIKNILLFLFFYVYPYASLAGFLYLKEYKKAIKVLERKISFKL